MQGQKLWLMAQGAVAEHLLELLQKLLKTTNAQKIVQSGQDVASDLVATSVVPQQLVTQALTVLQVWSHHNTSPNAPQYLNTRAHTRLHARRR